MRTQTIPTGGIEKVKSLVRLIRGQRVMLDADLAILYGVRTKELNKAVGRNMDRFPSDFMFRLTAKEMADLRFQSGTSSWGGRRTLPKVFTEQGVAMLSSVLRSKRAVQVNIGIMRAFVHLRQLISNNSELTKKFAQLEQRVDLHDEKIEAIFGAIRELMAGPDKPVPEIGFKADK